MARYSIALPLLAAIPLATLHCSSTERSFERGEAGAGGSDGSGASSAEGGKADSTGPVGGDGSGARPGGDGGSETGEGGKGSCDEGYTGSQCEACAEGYARAEDECVMDCGSCGDHEECRLLPSPASCSCVVTYELDEEEGVCVFSGAIESPRFTEPGAWDLTGATIDPTAFGPSAGSATFTDAAWCEGAEIAQTVTMPPIDLAGPLVLEVHAERIGTSPYECTMSGTLPGVNLMVGGQTQLLGLRQNWTFGSVFKRSYCLGEAAFGGDVEFRFLGDRAGCSSNYNCPKPVLHELSVREAAPDECPTALGEVANGRFNAAEGWRFAADQANGLAGSRAEVVNGRLELAAEYTCSNVSATTAVSVPLDATLANAALRFDVAGTESSRARLWFGGDALILADELVGAGLGSFSEVTVCLPEFARGLVSEYRFELLNASNGCNAVDSKAFYFDNMDVVSEPACEHDRLRDGGFELGQQLNVSSWNLTDGDDDCSNCEGTARIVIDPSLAHSGSRVLEFSFAGVEKFGTPSAQTAVRIPLATTAGAPAVKFWYRKTGAGAETLTTPSENVVGTNTWTEHTVCLPAYQQGALLPLTFSSLKLGVPGSTHYIDDVSVELDPSCL